MDVRQCTETVTVFNARVDPVTRAEEYAPTVLRGVSWRGEMAAGVVDGGLRAENAFVLRIPEAVDAGGKAWADARDYRTAGDVSGLWTLRKGDVIVKGGAAEAGMSPALLQALYGAENVMTVLGVTDNRRAPRARHWKVTGA